MQSVSCGTPVEEVDTHPLRLALRPTSLSRPCSTGRPILSSTASSRASRQTGTASVRTTYHTPNRKPSSRLPPPWSRLQRTTAPPHCREGVDERLLLGPDRVEYPGVRRSSAPVPPIDGAGGIVPRSPDARVVRAAPPRAPRAPVRLLLVVAEPQTWSGRSHRQVL